MKVALIMFGLAACGGSSAMSSAFDPLPPSPEPAGAIDVPITELKRVAGDPLLIPDDLDRAKMSEHGGGTAAGDFRVCLDAAGKTVTGAVVATTGLPNYDQKILTRLRTFAYEPHLVDGKATPVCTKLRFVYKQGG